MIFIGFQKSFIITVGGKDLRNFVKRILQRLFTNELSSKCSWTGFRNNFRLENLIIINIIKGTVNFVIILLRQIIFMC